MGIFLWASGPSVVLNKNPNLFNEIGSNKNESLNIIVLFSNPATLVNLTLIVINLPLNTNGSTLPNSNKCFKIKIPSNLLKL